MGTCRSPVTFSVFVAISVCVLGGRRNIYTARDTAVFFPCMAENTPTFGMLQLRSVGHLYLLRQSSVQSLNCKH